MIEIVLDFYNKRRLQLSEVQPNEAHYSLVKLEEKYQVEIITQNVDDLHERSGSKNVIHLHGELLKMRSSINPNLIYTCKNKIKFNLKMRFFFIVILNQLCLELIGLS